MLSDLAALAPPLLVCAAFVIAVVAFLRHEMRRPKKSSEDDSVEVCTQVSADQSSGNQADWHPAAQLASDPEDDPESEYGQ